MPNVANGLEDKDLSSINEDEIVHRRRLEEQTAGLVKEAAMLISGKQKDFPGAITKLEDAIKQLKQAKRLHTKQAEHTRYLSTVKSRYARQLFDRVYRELNKGKMTEAKASLKDALINDPKLKPYVQAVLTGLTHNPKLKSRAQALLRTIKSKDQMKGN